MWQRMARCGNVCALKTTRYNMCGDLWPFCDNPFCPDPIWKPVTKGCDSHDLAAAPAEACGARRPAHERGLAPDSTRTYHDSLFSIIIVL